MYVWEEKLCKTTWEQDCFKFSLEKRERRQLSGVLWKLIPCCWNRMWKRPFSEFRPKSWLDVTRRVGRAQTKWTWWSICQLQHVGEVWRAATVVYTVHRQAQLVFNSWANRKPVQLVQISSDVFDVRDMERHRWAMWRRSGLFEVAGVSTGEGPPTPSCSSPVLTWWPPAPNGWWCLFRHGDALDVGDVNNRNRCWRLSRHVDVNWLQVQPQQFPGCQSQQW